jgi:hypothetical protein
MGILLGGHAFHVPASDLVPSLWFCVGSGVGLAALEAGPRLVWFHQLRGLVTLGKLVLVAAVPFFWHYRLPILLVVVAIGSVGSHMPARFRYYSVIHRRVIRCGSGPGLAQWAADSIERERRGEHESENAASGAPGVQNTRTTT